MKADRHIALLLAGCLGAAAVNAQTEGTVPAYPPESVPAYKAVYTAYYQGRRVGEAEFSVVPVGEPANAYEFRSESGLTGLYRLFARGRVEEVSTFVYEGGRIRPLSYSLHGGRGQDSDFDVVFDWERGIATTLGNDLGTTTNLVPGVLDRGSLQVLLMLLGDGGVPGTYTLLDRDGLEVHELRPDGDEIIETTLGQFETRKLIQQRVGSSRRTLIWLAPEMRDLPVLIERQNDGETRAAFRLQSVDWYKETAEPGP